MIRRTALVVPGILVGLALFLPGCSSPTSPGAMPSISTPVATTSGGSSSATSTTLAKDRVEICHYDADLGAWTKLSLPEAAAAAHLENHNDARAGETTPDGTLLDASCVPPVGCPCFTAASLTDLFAPGEPDRHLTCTYSSFASWIHDLDQARVPKWVAESMVTDTGYRCYVDRMDSQSADPGDISRTITLQQHQACVEVIGAAQLALDCR